MGSRRLGALRKYALLIIAMAALCFCMAMPTAAYAADGTRGFSDVKAGSWYAKEEILGYVVDNGFISGYGNGRFGPSDQVKRGQVATILWRMAGKPAPSGDQFADVAEGKYYTDAVRWARTAGVVNGYSSADGAQVFGPEDPVTRQQLAKMLESYAANVASKGTDSDGAALSQFPDAGDVSSWGKRGLSWAVDNKLITGSVSGDKAYVLPNGTATRAQMAKMIAVLHRDVIGGGGSGAIKYCKDVIVLDDISWTEDASGGMTLSLVQVGDVKQGDILVLNPTQEHPQGSVVKVSDMRIEGDSVRVFGTVPETSEVIDELYAEGTADGSAFVIPAPGVEMEQASAAELLAWSGTLDRGTLKFKVKKFNLSIAINPTIDYLIDFKWGKLRKMDIAFNTDATVSAGLKASKTEKFPLCETYLPTEVPGLWFESTLYAEVSASGKVTVSLSDTSTVGGTYKDGKFTFKKKRSTNVGLDASAKLSAGFGLEAGVTVLGHLDLAKIGVELGAEAKPDDLVTRDNGMVCVDIESSGYGEFFFETPIFDYSIPIASVPLAKTHLENSKVVPRCTWKDPGAEAPGSSTGGGGVRPENPSQPAQPDPPSQPDSPSQPDQPSKPNHGSDNLEGALTTPQASRNRIDSEMALDFLNGSSASFNKTISGKKTILIVDGCSTEDILKEIEEIIRDSTYDGIHFLVLDGLSNREGFQKLYGKYESSRVRIASPIEQYAMGDPTYPMYGLCNWGWYLYLESLVDIDDDGYIAAMPSWIGTNWPYVYMLDADGTILGYGEKVRSSLKSLIAQYYGIRSGDVGEPDFSGAPIPAIVEGSADQTEAKKLLSMVNSERAKNGSNSLSWSASLENAAKLRAAEIAYYYSHTRPNGQKYSTAFEYNGASGENIAFGYGGASTAHDAWTSSAGHYANMTNDSFKSMAAACYRTPEGKEFWVELFAATASDSEIKASNPGTNNIEIKVSSTLPDSLS